MLLMFRLAPTIASRAQDPLLRGGHMRSRVYLEFWATVLIGIASTSCGGADSLQQPGAGGAGGAAGHGGAGSGDAGRGGAAGLTGASGTTGAAGTTGDAGTTGEAGGGSSGAAGTVGAAGA